MAGPKRPNPNEKRQQVSLGDGDRLQLESTQAPGQLNTQYNVRLFHNDQDMGVKVTIDEDTALVLEGKGKDNHVSIPPSLENFSPRIEINTKNPVTIDGPFILDKDSKKSASIAAVPVAVAENDEGQLSVRYKIKDESTRAVSFEKGSKAAIHFVDPKTEELVFSISGKDTLKSAKKKLDTWQKEHGVEKEQAEEHAPVQKKERAPALTAGELKALETVELISNAPVIPGHHSRAEEKAIRIAMNRVAAAGDALQREGGNTAANREQFTAALDVLIEDEKLPMGIRKKYESIRDDFQDENAGAPGKKDRGQSEYSPIDDKIASQARNAVDPSLKGQVVFYVPDAASVIPDQVAAIIDPNKTKGFS